MSFYDFDINFRQNDLIPVEIMQFVRKDMDVNEHERQFNFTLRHKLM